MCTIIGSSGRDCVLIILFQLYGSRAGHFEGDFQVGECDPQTFILEEELIQYKYNLMQFLRNQVKKLLILSYRCWCH